MDSAKADTTSPAAEPSFEALRPRRTVWSVAITALLALVVGGVVWVAPSVSQVPLGYPLSANKATWAVVPQGTRVNLIPAAVKADVLGGATVTGLDPVGNARLIGAWLLDASQEQQLEYATSAWSGACYDPASPDETAPACRLPADDSQADVFLAALVQRGAPLDETTALPRHLANRQTGMLVGLWLASDCPKPPDNQITLRVTRFGIPGTSSVNLVGLPGCWG